jgi:hypothetical protein
MGVYVNPSDDDPGLQYILDRILKGQVRSRWSDKFNTSRFPNRRLVKEVRATNLLPWMVPRFTDVPIIYLLRHPIPTAWSVYRLGWPARLDEYLGQTALIEGPLAPWRAVITETAEGGDYLLLLLLRWCLENVVPITQLAADSVHIIFYEHLVEDPHGELTRLGNFLARFDLDNRFLSHIDRSRLNNPSQTSWNSEGPRSPAERLESWTQTVPIESVTAALRLVGAFGLGWLYDSNVGPLVAPDQVLEWRVKQRQRNQ